MRIFQTMVVKAALLMASAFSFGPVRAETPQEMLERVLREEMVAAGTPAMTALVLQNGQEAAAATIGLADPGKGDSADPDTVFPAGSISKLLTAALVMTEVEAGRLDLDLPVNDYLSAAEALVDGDGTPVPATLRQILSHTSGLPVSWDGIPPNPPVTSTEDYLAANRSVIRPPGAEVVYSNSAMTLAGVIAARSAGMGFEDFAQERLLAPLGMTRSSFGAPGVVEGLAMGHVRKRNGDVEPAENPDLSALAPAGGLLTTARDLGQFARLILGAGRVDGTRVLSPASVSKMLTMQAQVHPDLDEGFGLGFGLRQESGRRVAWWDGSTGAAAAHLSLLPDEGLAVIVLSNLADNHATSVAGRRIRDALAPPGEVAPFAPPSDRLAALTGNYRTLDFVDPSLAFLSWLMPLRVVERDGELSIRSAMVGEMELLPVAADRFTVRGTMLDGSAALFDGDRLYVGFVRAVRQPVLLSPPALFAYAGLIVVILLALIVWAVVRLVRRRRAR